MTAIAQVNNFTELMESRGMQGSTPYQWGRTMYKYTDCGPWTVFLTDECGEIYYESKEANDEETAHIIGIKIGSIVEGSDVEIEPVTLRFPFNPEEIDDAINDINDQASFYWDRDNSDFFYVTSPRGTPYTVKNTWGEVKWEDKPRSEKVIREVEKMVGEDLWSDDPSLKGCIVRHNFPEYGSVAKVNDCKGWTVTYYLNDCEY